MEPVSGIDQTHYFDKELGNSVSCLIPDDIPMELPNIHQDRPSYHVLVGLLSILVKKPNVWEEDDTETTKNSIHLPYTEEEIRKFCVDLISAISKSKLNWLKEEKDDDGVPISVSEQEEKLINLASVRITERCGPLARGEITRSWIIPGSTTQHRPEFRLNIREPSYTEDNIGLKTWGTAYAIAKKLNFFGNQYMSELLAEMNFVSTGISLWPSGEMLPKASVLELGSGTGLVGITAAGIWGCDVTLTDMKEIVPNLLYNINENSNVVSTLTGGRMYGEVLNWAFPETAFDGKLKTFDIILVADPLYDDDHPAMLARNIARFLEPKNNARALVAVPLRDPTTTNLLHTFEKSMVSKGFIDVAHGVEPCHDDWEEKDEETVMIEWIIWARKGNN